MKKIKITHFAIISEGYGHNKIVIDAHDPDDATRDYQSEQYSTTTDNTLLIDRIKNAEDGDQDAADARVEAAKMVLTRNGVVYDEIIMDKHLTV